jgi:hypothetical protein
MVIRGASELIFLVVMAARRDKLFKVFFIVEKFSFFLFGFSADATECAPVNNEKKILVVPVKVLMMEVTLAIVFTDFMKVIHVELR